MERKLTAFLKLPLSDGRLKFTSALAVFFASVFVNAYFQVTSFSALAVWYLRAFGEKEFQQQLNQILIGSERTIGVRVAFGLLMTIFVMIFLLLAAYWQEKEKGIKRLFERACSALLVPVLLMLIAALLMNVSLAAGIFFSISAAADCMAVIISAGKRANVNEYLLITISTAFFMITVVLLTRNHFMTLSGLI